jgi:hypothetical protein
MTSNATGKMRKSFNAVSAAAFSVKGAVLGIGGAAVARSFVKAADRAEGFAARLETLLGSVSEGNRLFDDMATFAGKVPFEYEQIMSSATALSGVMKGGVDEINQWMPMIGDLAAVTGLSVEDTTSQVIRMYSAGAAAADMFRERGVLSMLGFKAGVSVSAEETREIMMREWSKADSQFRGATDRLAKTWSGMVSMLSDKWFKFRTDTMDAGLFDFMKEGLSQINDFLDEAFATGQAQEWAKTLSDFGIKAIKKMVIGVGWLVDIWNGLGMTWKLLKLDFLKFSEAIWTGLIKLREVTTSLFEALDVTGKGWAHEWAENSKQVLEDSKFTLGFVQKEINKTEEELNDAAVGYELMSDKAREWVEGVEEGAQKIVVAQDKVKSSTRDVRAEAEAMKLMQENATKEYERMLKASQKWFDDVRTPQEEFNQQMEELNQLVIDGMIDWETWGRAVEAGQAKLDDLGEDGKTFAGDMNNAVTGWASDFSSTLNDLLWDGRATFDDILRSFMKMVTQMVIQSAVVRPLLSSFGFSGFAKGGVFSGGRVTAFANGGVVTGPTMFPMKDGAGLMGEAGPEAVMPLQRGPGGRLGVTAEGVGSNVVVNIINNTNANIRVEESEGPGSVKTLDVIVDEIMQDKLATGKSAGTLRNVFGLRPQLNGG